MKEVKAFISGFFKRSGVNILGANVLARICAFLSSWLALYFIDDKELGVVIFSFSIIQFLIPFAGLGLQQSFLRYTPFLKTEEEKVKLYAYVTKYGFLSSIILILLVLSIGYFIPFKNDQTYFYYSFLSLTILTTFIFALIKVKFRLEHRNKLFASAEIVNSLIFVFLTGFLSSAFFELGYALAIVLTPLITSFLYLQKARFNVKSSYLNFDKKEFWMYGFMGGLTNVVTQLLVLIDIILIGVLMDGSENVTNYKYVSLIPFSILFLPRSFITTDFVTLTEKINDKSFIADYIKNYLKIFSLLSLILLVVFFFSKDYLLLIFNEEVASYSNCFLILSIGIFGIFLLRNLYGNLLSVIGEIKYNYYIITVAILLNIVSNYFLIPKYGIEGAAITSSVLMWLTGGFSMLFFYRLYSRFH